MSRLVRAAYQHREEVLRWSLTRRWTVFLLLWATLTVAGDLFFILCAQVVNGRPV
jgi:membrane protein YqaA with SNARE-associated domain